MPKVPINSLASGFRSSNRLNDNFETIQDAFDNTLSRDGTGPNQMMAELDMNSNPIINVPDPSFSHSAVNKNYVDGLVFGVVTNPLISQQVTLGDTIRVPSSNAVAQAIKDVTGYINVRDYYAGTMPFVSAYTSLTYAVRQTAPNITSALQAAINDAASRRTTGAKIQAVYIPPGLYTLSSTITVPSGVVIVGSGNDLGEGSTHLRRTGDYGDTFVFGTVPYAPGSFVSDSGMKDLRIYQDHGRDSAWGWDLAVSGTFINKTTTGSHINCSWPVSCLFQDIDLYGITNPLRVFSGVQSYFNRMSINGAWDPTSSTYQETTIGLLIDGSLSGIPTYHVFEDILFNGPAKTNQSVTYPGGNVKTGQVLNCGMQYGIKIRCLEEVYFRRITLQAMSKSDILFSTSTGTIIQDANFVQCTLDPCGYGSNDACVRFENEDVGGQCTSVNFTGCVALGQTNNYRVVSDLGSTATVGSVNSFSWIGGQMSSFVGNPVWLENGRRVMIIADIKDYNNNNFYTGDSACGIYLGTGVKSAYIGGIIGGDTYGNRTGHYCYDGVRAADGVNSSVRVVASDGGVLNSLFVSGTIPIAQEPANIPGGTFVGDANLTVTHGITPSYILQGGTLTADRTITLGQTDQFGRAVLDGAKFRIYRNGGGAFNLTIQSSTGPTTITTLTAAGKWCDIFRYSGTWRLFGGN